MTEIVVPHTTRVRLAGCKKPFGRRAGRVLHIAAAGAGGEALRNKRNPNQEEGGIHEILIKTYFAPAFTAKNVIYFNYLNVFSIGGYLNALSTS